ncbi:hypothetical protein ACE6H2_004114 [Prunus campanulata]
MWTANYYYKGNSKCHVQRLVCAITGFVHPSNMINGFKFEMEGEPCQGSERHLLVKGRANLGISKGKLTATSSTANLASAPIRMDMHARADLYKALSLFPCSLTPSSFFKACHFRSHCSLYL